MIIEFAQILALILGNAAIIIPLFLWNRAESRTDIRNMDQKLDDHRNETHALINAIREEAHSMINAIREDIKDFHGRLCAIEERNRR